MAPSPVGRPPGGHTGLGGCPRPLFGRVGEAPRGGRGGSGRPGRAAGGAGVSRQSTRGGPAPGGPLPPFGHDGIERRIERPQDPIAQTRCDSGQKTGHTVKNVLLLNASLTIL